MAGNHDSTGDRRLLDLEQELCALERTMCKAPDRDQGRLADEALGLEQELGELAARSLEGVACKLQRVLLMIREGRAEMADPHVRTALAAVDRLREEPRLADLMAGQVEIAHTLANMKMGVNLIADGVRALLDQRPAGG